MIMIMSNDLREKMAALVHGQWCGWMKYLFSCGDLLASGQYILPCSMVNKWQRQMRSRYEDLSESEREIVRDCADALLDLIDKEGS